MTPNTAAFDHWIRTSFVEMNTALEELYIASGNGLEVDGVGDSIKYAIRDEGAALIQALLAEGKTNDGSAEAFALLGNVGMYLGSMRRHELTNPDHEDRSPFEEASALAIHIGTSIGMAPRFATAHLATHNLAVDGVRKSFTSLPDEFLFIDENTRAILSFQSAADALVRISDLGVSSPVADILFGQAAAALRMVAVINARLFLKLNVDRFFCNVRPYYKPYRVGRTIWRGANAGDFAGINEIDLLLGLCRANDPYYAQLLIDKLPFMMPGEQQRLRACMNRRSLLDQLLDAADHQSDAPWFRANAAALLELCDLFAVTARQHHDQLVNKFIQLPAGAIQPGKLTGITASGPPLEVMIRSLETLRNLRCAVASGAAASRHADLARLAEALSTVDDTGMTTREMSGPGSGHDIGAI
ncbi:monodechloroaminopyrrolnitrin synthase PrnB family protein [Sphingobium sp. Sx8-8]|uniref:PrnB family protein n=1 Tax=Sphingobium sp. Sx8-8 TaxID=2933617 RepID=UPI001F55D343|nr:monodechloroaminopyrrolnitrin synthase PrnB family protein [Sphingobium sp. Sx8-8]